MQKSFRSNDLSDLSLSSQQNRDAALLRATTDLFVQEPAHDRDEIRRYEELATHFLTRVTAADRSYVAERLADRPDAPAPVIRMLARDAIEIARYVIPASPALTSLDLLSIIAATGAEHHRLVATRKNLPAEVDRALRLMGNVDIDLLAGHERSAMGDPESAAQPPGLQHPLPRARRTAAIDSAEFDVWHFLGLERGRRLRLMADLATGPPLRSYAGPASRLDQAFRSILGAAQIVSFARRGQRRELVTAIAESVGIDIEIVIACVDDPSGEAFAVLLKVLGLDTIQAQQVFLLGTPAIGADVRAFFRLADIYAALESSVAAALVSAWRGDFISATTTPKHAPVFVDNGTRRPVGTPVEVRRDGTSMPDQPATRDGTR